MTAKGWGTRSGCEGLARRGENPPGHSSVLLLGFSAAAAWARRAARSCVLRGLPSPSKTILTDAVEPGVSKGEVWPMVDSSGMVLGGL